MPEQRWIGAWNGNRVACSTLWLQPQERPTMLTRTALYEGSIAAGEEDAFFADVEKRLVPIWHQFPNVLAVRVQRVRSSDPGALPIVMILEMDFADRAALDQSLASDIKTRSHALTLDVLKPFNGRFFHLVADA